MLFPSPHPPANSPQKYIDEESDHVTADPLESNGEDIMEQKPAMKRLSIIAAQSGFVMSLMAQFATVGVYLLLSILVSSEAIEQTKLVYLVLPMASCVLNLILAICHLSVLHDLATHEYYNAHPERSTITKENMRTDKGLQETFHDIDIYYILGAVTGISLLWSSMDLFMGLQRQLLFPVTMLLLALVCLTQPQFQAYRRHRKPLAGEESAYYALPDSSKQDDSSNHLMVV